MRSRTPATSSFWRLKPLCASRYPAGRMSVTCVLYQVVRRHLDAAAEPPLFALGMEGGGTRSLCLVGDDEAHARRLFRDMARLTVTPCTLRDIVEDMEYGG